MTDEEYAKALAEAPSLALATLSDLFAEIVHRLQGNPIPEFRQMSKIVRALFLMMEQSSDGRTSLADRGILL